MGLFNSKELKKLRAENEELKTKFERTITKEKNIQHLDEVLKKLRIEVSDLNKQKQSIVDSISSIEMEEVHKKESMREINNRIEHLHSLKQELESQIFEYTIRSEDLKKELDNHKSFNYEAETITHGDNFSEYLQPEEEKIKIEEIKELDDLISTAKLNNEQLDDEENKLNSARLEKLKEIEDLQDKAKEYITILDDIESKIKMGNERIRQLKEEEENLTDELVKKQQEISVVESRMKSLEEEFLESERKLQILKEDERNLLGKVDDLKEIETTKLNKVRELDFLISEKDEIKSAIESEHQKLMNELNESKDILNQAQSQYETFLEDFRTRKKELFDTEQSLNIKAQRLSSVNVELMDLQKKNDGLKSELSELEQLRNTVKTEIQKEKEVAEKFNLQNKKLVELVPLLEKRKEEIEQSNALLEERFSVMFQKFNNELNEINRKRNLLEQIVVQKEKDVDEKDQLLFEKIAALEESESVLNTRKIEMESLEQIVESLKEQKEIYKTDLTKMEEEVIERKNFNNEVKLETELLVTKKNTLEKNLQDLLNLMNESYSRSKERNNKFESELNFYEERLQDFRNKIAASMKELEDLRNTVSSLKMEKHEYKNSVEKLGLLKKKLQEEILKHQNVLQRYQRIREKLRIEVPLGKNYDEIRSSSKSEQQNIKPAPIYKL